MVLLVHRIDTLDKGFGYRIRELSAETRETAVKAVCRELARRFSELPDDVRKAARRMDSVTDAIRDQVESTAEALDCQYLDLLDADASCEREFELARAATAISYGILPDGEGAEDCLYEASFALGGIKKLKVAMSRAKS